MDAAQLAIGLTETVLKLIHISFIFIGDVKQVYKQGATDLNVDLSNVVKNVALVTTSLETQLDTIGGNSSGGAHALDPLEEQLKYLSQRAADIGRELELKLYRVTTDKKSTWKSFKAVAAGMWHADEIEKIEKRLKAINNEIQSGILVDLRRRISQTHDENTSRLLKRIEEVTKTQARLRNDSTHIIELLNDADKSGQGRHKELLDAIHAISAPSSPRYTPIPLVLPHLQDQNARKAAEAIILNCLWYPRIREREETILEAHVNTFQWIFEDPKATGKPWDSFVDFFKCAGSAYWITGKPGSGKSTLMKFIIKSPKTQDLLQMWTGEKALIQASFYFYYGGDEYQKSEIGLFRSLLHSILSQRRELIPIAFKDRFQAALEGKRHNDPSFQEVKKALADLILHSTNINFFFSIDGLDELDPEVSMTTTHSLIEFTHFLENCKNVKLLVSSRPLVEFESGYDGRRALRVHDLTREDIRRYVHEKLMSHRRMKILEKENPNITDELVQPIVDCSLGVFLWVRVVTGSLIEGLTNYDSLDDLKKCLQGLPSDLQDLYSTIIGRIKPSYKQEAVRLLYFIYRMYRYEADCSLLDLWFAENADDGMVRNTPIRPIRDEELRDRFDGFQTRLKGRCLGLIETVHNSDRFSRLGPIMTNSLDLQVRLLHRSLYEFLSRQDVWDNNMAKQQNYAFSINLSLLRSAILLIKTYHPPPGTTWMDIARLGTFAGCRAALAEHETKRSHRHLIHELDLAMHGIMPLVHASAITKKTRGIIQTSLPNHTWHWSVWCRLSGIPIHGSIQRFWPLQDIRHGSLVAFAAEYGLKYYLQSRVTEKGCKILQKEGLPLLGYALIPFHFNRHLSNVETISLLLNEGSDPNEPYNGTSLWEWYLWTLPLLDRDARGKYTAVSWIITKADLTMETMLLAGAKPNGRMIRSSGDGVCLSKVQATWRVLWLPESVTDSVVSVCTILSALVQDHRILEKDINNGYSIHPKRLKAIDRTIQRMIKFLRERDALEKEWNDGNSIGQMFLKLSHRMCDKNRLFVFKYLEFTEPEEESAGGDGAFDMPLLTTKPGTSTASEVSVDPASSERTDASHKKIKSDVLAVNKKAKEANAVNYVLIGRIARPRKRRRKLYNKTIRKFEYSLRRWKKGARVRTPHAGSIRWSLCETMNANRTRMGWERKGKRAHGRQSQ
ncbi:hypothetical protein F5Y09DRAFT_351858 [Xylaria sp. FL1042]|nr:hypothetical protein F5Y09DRAFT_351858 [Xylaria sp. FL1042]